MTQTYEKVIEIEIEIEQPEVETPIESEVDELLGDLNPRYFEEAMTLEDARQKINTSDISFSSKFNVFTTY
ncbi:MAG: hypothetical protein ACW96S_00365 [Promethearchaeota archaeon]|jgi:hypothetical protein